MPPHHPCLLTYALHSSTPAHTFTLYLYFTASSLPSLPPPHLATPPFPPQAPCLSAPPQSHDTSGPRTFTPSTIYSGPTPPQVHEGAVISNSSEILDALRAMCVTPTPRSTTCTIRQAAPGMMVRPGGPAAAPGGYGCSRCYHRALCSLRISDLASQCRNTYILYLYLYLFYTYIV